jgi:acetyl-CoA acetyltransferase
MFTTAEFALIARRHMHVYGTTREQLSMVAATIRNNGSRNAEAVYYQRGPFTPDDITASRPIADPYHLLDCATTSEGGCALVVANIDEVDATGQPIYVLGSGADFHGPSYQNPPAWDLAGRRGDYVNGQVGAQAFGFCGEGEGGPFVADGNIAIDGTHPVTTDGGTMSFSHAGANPQMMQRATRAVQQLRGEAGDLQVPDAHIALCSNGGAGALFTTLLILGDEPL